MKTLWLTYLLIAGTFACAGDIDFDLDIRPILSDKCFQCHGPDEAQRQADLRLDVAAGAFADRGGYSAFVAGAPEESQAIRRIFAEDPDELMPPPESKLRLSAEEKEVLRQWVASGAKWSEHWAFIVPRPSPVPLDTIGWSANEIDRFVLARASQAGLAPQPEADKETLIRRVTLDLTGLPPTIEEIDAFLADESPRAYETIVDRLLASPHYGERMAWEWLDAARYADTDGFQGDPTRTMWPWRDWLVDALNRNVPFDQFSIEMLAGDLLENATPEQILATGFNRNHMFNGEGGRIPEETRVENVFDRSETTGTIWLGLTLTCCRCHDHKFDPMTQKEYYQFFAFFNQTSETGSSGRGKTAPVLEYLTPENRLRQEMLAEELKDLHRKMTEPRPDLDQQQAEWEKAKIAQLSQSVGGATRLGPWWQLGPIEAEGQRAFDDDLGPEKSLSLDARYGNFIWMEKVELADGQVQPLPETVGATYFYRTLEASSERAFNVSLGSDDAIKVWLNGREVLSKFVTRGAEADQELLELKLDAGRNELLLKIVNTGGIGGFYFKTLSESQLGLPTEVVAALQLAEDQRSPAQRERLQTHFRSQHWDAWSSLVAKREQLKQELDSIIKSAVTVMVMDQRPDDRQRPTQVLIRGSYDQPATEVSANTPGFLPSLAGDTPRDRLALAKWLVDPSNPLTARVTVNRFWQTFFGKGLVASTEDFGSQGSQPTHPGLLDWLALRFVTSGWNVKELHKLMVMSSTYRQSSAVSAAAYAIDPENKWLARAPRYRLPSWMLRDQALAASGLLVDERGGPPVKPYQPDGIWAEATFGKIRYQPDSGDKLYRRSLYIFWRRIVGPTMFFDGSKRQTCDVKPTRTNTPLHALTTLNETAFVEAARAMAERVVRCTATDKERIELAFRLATGRKPDDDEVRLLQRRIASLRDDFSKHVEDAKSLLAVGASPRTLTFELSEQAAYTVLCSLLLNLDETLCKQ